MKCIVCGEEVIENNNEEKVDATENLEATNENVMTEENTIIEDEKITEEKTKQTNIVEESDGQLSLFGERNPNEADVIDAINQLNLLAMASKLFFTNCKLSIFLIVSSIFFTSSDVSK